MNKNTQSTKKTQDAKKTAKIRRFSSKSFIAYQHENPAYQLHDEALTAQPRLQRLFDWFYKPYNFITAPNEPGEEGKPDWTTQTGYPLTPRLAQHLFNDEATLFGCRPDETTCFGVYDIDAGSLLHPSTPEGFQRIKHLLDVAEAFGIVAFVPIRSSFSTGIHLLTVFDTPIRSIEMASLLRYIALTAGFTVEDGQLEIFPNTKKYVNSDNRVDWSMYRALRMPGQPGSGWQLLNDDFEPVGDSLEQLVSWLEWAEAKNDSYEIWRNAQIAYEQHKTATTLRNKNSRDRFISDLHIQLDDGFTASSQTNALLKLAATLGRVEHGYTGSELSEFIADTVTGLPGYKQFSHHQHHINKRAREWGRSVENFYWHICDANKVRRGSYASVWKRATKQPIDPARPTYAGHHKKLSDDALKRFDGVLNALIEAESEFTSETSLFAALCDKGRELYQKAFSKRTWGKLKETFAAAIASLLCRKVDVSEVKEGEILKDDVGNFPTAKIAEPQADCARTEPLTVECKKPDKENAKTQADCARTKPRLYMKVFEYLSRSEALALWQRLAGTGVLASYQGNRSYHFHSIDFSVSKNKNSDSSLSSFIKPFDTVQFLSDWHSSHLDDSAYNQPLVYVKPAFSTLTEGFAVPLSAIALPIDRDYLSSTIRRISAGNDKLSLSTVGRIMGEYLCPFPDK